MLLAAPATNLQAMQLAHVRAAACSAAAAASSASLAPMRMLTWHVKGEDDAVLLVPPLNHGVGAHHILLVDGADVDGGHRDLQKKKRGGACGMCGCN